MKKHKDYICHNGYRCDSCGNKEYGAKYNHSDIAGWVCHTCKFPKKERIKGITFIYHNTNKQIDIFNKHQLKNVKDGYGELSIWSLDNPRGFDNVNMNENLIQQIRDNFQFVRV